MDVDKNKKIDIFEVLVLRASAKTITMMAAIKSPLAPPSMEIRKIIVERVYNDSFVAKFMLPLTAKINMYTPAVAKKEVNPCEYDLSGMLSILKFIVGGKLHSTEPTDIVIRTTAQKYIKNPGSPMFFSG